MRVKKIAARFILKDESVIELVIQADSQERASSIEQCLQRSINDFDRLRPQEGPKPTRRLQFGQPRREAALPRDVTRPEDLDLPEP